MAESMYRKWLAQEEHWIGDYCNRTLKNSLLKVAPATLIMLMLFFGGMAFLGGGSTVGLLIGGFSGLIIGLIVCTFYLVLLFICLRPSRYIRKIEQSVKELSINEMEREQLGKEMLNALKDDTCVLNYKMIGPHSKGAPAKFIITPHYAFQEGSYPYAMLVRLLDIAEIKTASEQKTAVTRGAKTKTFHHFTLYTIGFYRKDRFERGLSGDGLPDHAMGFFQKKLRDDVVKMIQATGIEVTSLE